MKGRLGRWMLALVAAGMLVVPAAHGEARGPARSAQMSELTALGTSPSVPGQFHVLRHTPDGSNRELGVIALDEHYRIQVTTAEPGSQPVLDKLARDFNGQERLTVPVAPPADAPRFAEYTHEIERRDHRFGAALLEQLRTYHGVMLVADASLRPVPHHVVARPPAHRAHPAHPAGRRARHGRRHRKH